MNASATIAEKLAASGAVIKVVEGGAKKPSETPKKVDLSQFLFRAPKVPDTRGIPMTTEDQQRVRVEFARFKSELTENLGISATQVWQYLSKSESDRLPFRSGYDRVNFAIKEALDYEDGASRETARLVWIVALVDTAPKEQWVTHEITGRAIALGVFELANDGERFAIRVGRSFYKIGEGFVKNPDSRVLLGKFKALASEVYQACRQELADQSSALVAAVEQQITVADIRAGNPGQIVLRVPAYQILDHNRSEVWQASGTILVEVGTDRKVRIRQAAGPLSRFAGDLTSGEVFIYPEQIPMLKPSPTDRVRLKVLLPPDLYGRVMRLWRWVTEGVIYAEAEATKVAEAEAQMKLFEGWKKETLTGVPEGEDLLSPEEWLLDHREGLVFVNRAEFARPGDDLTFKWFIPKSDQPDSVQIDKEELNPMAILRREGGRISLVSCPAHQRDNFWRGIINPQSEGEKFADLPWQVGTLLKIFFGATVARNR